MADKPLRLIAGLGNPGPRYAETRHNAGFWFVDRLAARAQVVFRSEAKFHGDVCKCRIGGAEVWLHKPQTFMNESGRAVQALAAFYKLEPQEILVVHDEVDLPVGTIRLKRGGGHGGNNGLRSIVAHLGKDFLRLRVGVGRPERGGDVADYLLSRPSASDHAAIQTTLDDAESVLSVLLREGLEKAMHRLHSAPDEASVTRRNIEAGEAKPAVTTAETPPAQSRQEGRRQDGDHERAATRSLREQLLGLFRRR